MLRPAQRKTNLTSNYLDSRLRMEGIAKLLSCTGLTSTPSPGIAPVPQHSHPFRAGAVPADALVLRRDLVARRGAVPAAARSSSLKVSTTSQWAESATSLTLSAGAHQPTSRSPPFALLPAARYQARQAGCKAAQAKERNEKARGQSASPQASTLTASKPCIRPPPTPPP